MILALRGAICVDSDTPERIMIASNRLVQHICQRNDVLEEDIVSIVFSVTSDLRSANPASGLRRYGFSNTPLFCVQEAETDGSIRRVIRILLTAEKEPPRGREKAAARREAVHVYMDGAEALRPDLGS
jgi:chorismate mutase